MKEHKGMVRQNEEVLDQEHRFGKQGLQSSADSSYAWEQDSSIDMPFRPRRDSHSALLAKAQSDKQQASLVLQLQQTYGNVYVQRLLDMGVQAKLTVSDPNDIYEQEADELSQELKAQAFPTGRDILFRDGVYQPESLAGKGLLAHEPTHVVQQTAARAVQRQGTEASATETSGNLLPR